MRIKSCVVCGCWCVVAVAVLGACSRPEPVVTPVRAVKLVTAGAQAQNHEHEYAGEIRARTESPLGFQVGGQLQKRLVDVGQTVRAGQVLALLAPQDYQASAQAAAAQVLAAQRQHEVAVADLKRYESLLAQGFISHAEWERRQVGLQSAQAALQQAQAQASVSGNQAGYTQLLASADGVVVGVQAEPGQVLAAGMPVLRLAHSGPRDVVFSVPEDQLTWVKVGQAVHVQLWTQGQAKADPLTANIREVAASADALTRTFVVKAALPAGAAALGSTATVRWGRTAASAGAQGAIRLPLTALWQQGDGRSAVWVFDAQHQVVQARVVQVDSVDGQAVTVSAGLKNGEEVVAAGTHVLTPGQHVVRFKAAVPQAKPQPVLAVPTPTQGAEHE